MFGSSLPSLWSSTKVYSGRGSRHCYAIMWFLGPIQFHLSGKRVNQELDHRKASRNLRPKLFFWQANIFLSPYRLFKVFGPYLPHEYPSPSFGSRRSANSHDSSSDSADALRSASAAARH